MYMANGKILLWGPSVSNLYSIGSRWGFAIGKRKFYVSRWGNANFSVFRYQHVGIPNAKFSHWGYCPMQTPNVRSFALQWNNRLNDNFISLDSQRRILYNDLNYVNVGNCG